MNTETALITGASSGIGLALAEQFAQNGHPLILTAVETEKLEKVALQLGAGYGVPVATIAKDLTQETAAEEIFDELAKTGTSVKILVNDAGIGQRGEFAETPVARDVQIIRLNIEATVRLTKLFLRYLSSGDQGRILNVASVAGFEPGPLLAVYHASKAFVLSFSEALAAELENFNVTVTALCPGATDTDFFRKADMTRTKIYQEGKLMPPDVVAKAGYEAMMRGDRVHVPGGGNKTLVFIRRFTSIPTQANLNRRFYEEVKTTRSRRSTTPKLAGSVRIRSRRR